MLLKRNYMYYAELLLSLINSCGIQKVQLPCVCVCGGERRGAANFDK